MCFLDFQKKLYPTPIKRDCQAKQMVSQPLSVEDFLTDEEMEVALKILRDKNEHFVL
jgi:hypothetical protein